LRQGHGELSSLPGNQYQHVMGAVVFRRHGLDIDRFSFFERRGTFPGDARCSERELHVAFEVAVPTHCFFFGAVGIDDHFVFDSVFSGGIFWRFSHGCASLGKPAAAPSCALLEELANVAEAKQLFGTHERILQPRIIEVLVFDFKIVEFQIRLARGKIRLRTPGAAPRLEQS